MLLKNKSARLITVNHKGGSFEILPGNNPSVEVPNDLCEGSFIKALIECGDIDVESKEDKTPSLNKYELMSKGELTALCEAENIDVKVKDTAKILAEKLQANENQQ